MNIYEPRIRKQMGIVNLKDALTKKDHSFSIDKVISITLSSYKEKDDELFLLCIELKGEDEDNIIVAFNSYDIRQKFLESMLKGGETCH